MTQPTGISRNGQASARIAGWLEEHARQVIAAAVVITALLVVPIVAMETPDQASQDPDSRVLDLQDRIDNTFSSNAHVTGFIVESRTGDILTPAGLSELLRRESELRSTDQAGGLAPGGLPSQSYLQTYFDTASGRQVEGLVTLADVVNEVLMSSPDIGVPLSEATEEQVKLALHRIFSNEATTELRESLSVRATSETRTVNGQETQWWTSPALVFFVVSDNEKLGGGTQSIGVGSDERTLDKEEYNRNLQEVLRGDEDTYRLWGIAIDVNLESGDQGQASGAFITFTVIAAIAVVGITLRSYWAVALTGAGLGALVIWLKGLSLLVGLKGGLVIDLIVPIAMVSLGVDFAVHAVRRYQEERKTGYPPRRAFVIGMTGVLAALFLALMSDGIAFLSNTAAGIEAVIHFGVAAGIAVASSFLVLGVVVPLALSRIETVSVPRRRSGLRRVVPALGSFGAAAGAGGAVILMVAVSPLAGAAVLAITFAGTILLPLGIAKIRNRRPASTDAVQQRTDASEAPGFGDGGPHMIDRLVALTRYRYAVMAFFAVLTGLSVIAALRLEATFDVKDFFSSDSDFVVSLDKLDEHVAERSGEPAIVLIEGDLSDPAALTGIKTVFDNLGRNQLVSRNSEGVVNISEPNVIQVVREMTSTAANRQRVEQFSGVAIAEHSPYALPQEAAEIGAVLDYVLANGVPNESGELIYTPEDMASVLRYNPPGSAADATQFSVFLPGTREQSNVSAAHSAIDRDLQSLRGVSSITDFGVTGSPFVRQEQLEATTRSLQTSIPIAAGAALVLLIVAFRSVRYAVVTIIPIGLVVAWLYAIMWVSGFALNFVTATIGAVSIGVGIDFSIHLTERFREEFHRNPGRVQAMRAAMRGTGVALAGSAGSSIVGFAIMGLAPMPLFASYGLLTSIMILLALAAALLVLPSLLMAVTPERSPQANTTKAAREAVATRMK